MVHKIKRILPMLFIISVLLSACSKNSTAADTSGSADTDEIWTVTGYYLRTWQGDMIIKEQSITVQNGVQAPYKETLYEPTVIYFGDGEEETYLSIA